MGKTGLHPGAVVEVAMPGSASGFLAVSGCHVGAWDIAHADDHAERKDRMRGSRPIFTSSRAVEDLQHLRLMALLGELVRDKGIMKAAKALDVDHRTLTSSMENGNLSKRMRAALEKALLEGGGTPAAEQRERNDELEARLDTMQGQLKELKEELRVLNRLEARLEKTEGKVKEMRGDHRAGLKALRMSLDGVRKYYGAQRRLTEERLLALEAGRDYAEAWNSARDGGPGTPPARVPMDSLEGLPHAETAN